MYIDPQKKDKFKIFPKLKWIYLNIYYNFLIKYNKYDFNGAPILTHLNSADEYIWNELLLVYYNLFAQWTYQFNKGQGRLSDFSFYIDSQISIHWKFKK